MRLLLIILTILTSACAKDEHRDVPCSLEESAFEYYFDGASSLEKASYYKCMQPSGIACEAITSADQSQIETDCQGDLFFDK